MMTRRVYDALKLVELALHPFGVLGDLAAVVLVLFFQSRLGAVVRLGNAKEPFAQIVDVIQVYPLIKD